MVFGQSEEFDERSRISKSVRKFTKQVESVKFPEMGVERRDEKQLRNVVGLKIDF